MARSFRQVIERDRRDKLLVMMHGTCPYYANFPTPNMDQVWGLSVNRILDSAERKFVAERFTSLMHAAVEILTPNLIIIGLRL